MTSVGLEHSDGAMALEPLRHLAPETEAAAPETGLQDMPGATGSTNLAAVRASGATLGADLLALEKRLAEKDALTHQMANEVQVLQGNIAKLVESNQEDAAELRQARELQLKQAQATAALSAEPPPPQSTAALASQGQPQQGEGKSPCSCVASSSTWAPCKRTTPKCIWIDLGAADGNSFKSFLENYYGPVGNCPNGQWEAVLVEANPRFDQALSGVASEWPGSMHMYSSTAAYMCKAQTTFFLDTVTHANNYWGSSMSANAADVKASGLQKVTVPTLNLNQILYEMTIPGDWVMVKMDIEGAEWDILPCLALAPAASLVDRLFVEIHNQSMSNTGTDPATMEAAQSLLRLRGIDIPAYFSNTL